MYKNSERVVEAVLNSKEKKSMSNCNFSSHCCGLCSWTEVIWFVFLFFSFFFNLYFSSGAEMSSISKGKQVLNGHFKLCNHLSKDMNHVVSTK